MDDLRVTEEWGIVEPWGDMRAQLTGPRNLKPLLHELFLKGTCFRGWLRKQRLIAKATDLKQVWIEQRKRAVLDEEILKTAKEQQAVKAKANE